MVVAATVFVRAVLDFAGVAALIPVLALVLGDNPDRLKGILLCGAVLLIVVAKNGVVVGLSRFQSKFLLGLTRRISRTMFERYYGRGLLFIKSKSTVQLGYEVNFISYMFSLNVLAPILRMMSDGLLLLLIAGALVVYSPVAGLLLLGTVLPLLGLYGVAVKGRMNRYGKEELEARRQQSRLVVEAFRGYSELEVGQAFGASLKAFDEGLDRINAYRLRYELLQMWPMLLSEGAIVLGIGLLLATGEGDLRVMSGIFAVAAYKMIPSARSLLNGWNTIQNSSHAVQTVEEGLNGNVPDMSTHDDGATMHLHEALEVRDLSFRFPDGEKLLRGINMSIRRGEHVGICGASGSGKSTLFNLMLGFFPPTGGGIWIDGKKLERGNRAAWHRTVGYVPQEIFVIKGTLAENIALGQKKIDRRRVERVLEQVQLEEWSKALPDGLDTELGEYGNRLSGGQKQRIGIARALYKQSEVLFFDEATSSLDNDTEREINEAIAELGRRNRDLTMIVIAHRESTLRFCDRIVKMEELQ